MKKMKKRKTKNNIHLLDKDLAKQYDNTIDESDPFIGIFERIGIFTEQSNRDKPKIYVCKKCGQTYYSCR